MKIPLDTLVAAGYIVVHMTATELRQMRVGAGLTQLELAQRIGVGRVTVTRWESEARSIGAAQETAIRAVLGQLPKGPDMRSRNRVGRAASGRRLSVKGRSKTAPLANEPVAALSRKTNGSNDIPS